MRLMFPVPLLMTLIMGAMVLVTLWLGTRFLMEVFSWLFNGGRSRRMRRRYAGGIACRNPRCRQLNPAEANFCAQCGRALRRSYWTGGP